MAVTLTLLRIAAPGGSPREILALVTPSGNYVNGGDTMDLTKLYGQVSQEGCNIDSDQLPIDAVIESLAGGGAGGGYYLAQLFTNPGNGQPATPKALNACLFRAFQANGTEYTSAAYNASVISDRIILILKYAPAQ
jgi:hypothetical protein